MTGSKIHRVLFIPTVLHVPELGIWHGCEYVRVKQDDEYA